MIPEHARERARQPNDFLWMLWCIVSCVSGALAIVGSSSLDMFAMTHHWDREALLYTLAMPTCAMLIISSVQWLILRQCVGHAWVWIPTSMFSGLGAWMLMRWLYGPGIVLLPCLLLGFGQYIFLWRRIRYAPLWIGAGIFAMVMGAAIVFAFLLASMVGNTCIGPDC